MTPELSQAIADVRARRFERVAKPGHWRVYRTGDTVHVELWG